MATVNLPSAVDALLQKQEGDVLSVEQIGSFCALIVSHLESKDDQTLTQAELQSVLHFITAASVNHEAFSLDIFSRTVLKFYQVCSNLSQSECVTSLNAQISSLSLSLLTVMEKGSGVYLEPLMHFHSVVDSKESQQFLEMMAVKMPKQFVSHLLKLTGGDNLNVQLETPVEKLRQVSALIAPTAMLIVSRSSGTPDLMSVAFWAVKCVAVSVDPLVRQRCLTLLASYLIVHGTEKVQDLFVCADVKFALLFSLSCVEIKMAIEDAQHSKTAVLSNDSLSCLLSSLDVALDDICAGRVHMTSPEEFMTVFDSYKALSLTLFELLSSETARPNQDWLLICNVWKLISTYLCETDDLPDLGIDVKNLIRSFHRHMTECQPEMRDNLVRSVLPLFFLASNKPALVEFSLELGLQHHFVNFLLNNALANNNPKVKSIILCCQILVSLSANHVLSELDSWKVDVNDVTDDDIFLHVTRLLLKSSCSAAILHKSADDLALVIERLNKIALDVDGYYDECLETLELLKV